MLEWRGVAKYYSGIPAVNDVSFSARSVSGNELATFWMVAIRKLVTQKIRPDDCLVTFPPNPATGTNSPTTESSSTLASVTRLVQYCVNTCSAVDAAQRTIPLLQAHGRRSAATDF
jgi:hypothetical protein